MKMLQNNETLTIDEIASRLNVVPRTIYRYIDTLKEAGFTVVNIMGDIYSMVEMPQPVTSRNTKGKRWLCRPSFYLVKNFCNVIESY